MKRPSKRAGNKALDYIKRLGGLGSALTLALMTAACVSNDEFDQARMDRDEFRGELQRLHLSNDDLKREIPKTYASCDQITSQLTVMAAMDIHDKYTDKLGRPPQPPEEVKPPDPEPKPAPSGSFEGGGSRPAAGEISGHNAGSQPPATPEIINTDSAPVRAGPGRDGLDGMDISILAQ